MTESALTVPSPNLPNADGARLATTFLRMLKRTLRLPRPFRPQTAEETIIPRIHRCRLFARRWANNGLR
jgi:hypothetical protein